MLSMYKKLLFIYCCFLSAVALTGCGGEPKTGEAVQAPEPTSAASAPVASSAGSKETPLPAITSRNPDETPIKIRRPDTAKMAAALRQIASAHPSPAAVKMPVGGQSSFAGKWTLEKNIPGASFEVEITQWNDELRGSYCATADSGAKKDCVTDEGEQYPSFRAPVPAGATLATEFITYRENDKGKIKLSLENGRLHWVITQTPKTECYAQRDAWLKRKK